MQLHLLKEVREQMDIANEVILNITGQKTILFRPPYGTENSFIFREAEKRGYVIIEWSASGRDWETQNSEIVAERILKGTINGTIILMHDGRRLKKEFDCNSTLNTLPIIIENLTAEGYKFVTVPELLGLGKN